MDEFKSIDKFYVFKTLSSFRIMTDYHTKTFYGQKSSIRLTSPSKSTPYVFLSCINRKEDGKWENTSEGEGKTVKISIEEIICILEIVEQET